MLKKRHGKGGRERERAGKWKEEKLNVFALWVDDCLIGGKANAVKRERWEDLWNCLIARTKANVRSMWAPKSTRTRKDTLSDNQLS